MDTGVNVHVYEFTLRPPGPSNTNAPARVLGAEILSLAAGSEWRVSGDVRRVSWDLSDRYALEPIEALCHVGPNGTQAGIQPGIVLLDPRFPIWLAILDDAAFLSVDTELLAGAARLRFHAVRDYIEFLAARGYSEIFDHRAGTLDVVNEAIPGIVERLASAGTSRRFDRLRTDSRIGFLGGFVGSFLCILAVNALQNDPEPYWLSGLRGLVIGSFVWGFQYYQARVALKQRLRQIRAEIITEKGTRERLVFTRPNTWFWNEWTEGISTVLIAGLALLSYVMGTWSGVVIFGGVFVVGAASLFLRRHLLVVLDAHFIEGLSARGRTRIAYTDIDQIKQWSFPEFGVVSSADRNIWLPQWLENREQLVDVLWERVDLALTEAGPSTWAPDLESMDRLRDRLERSRKTLSFRMGRCIPDWPPLWVLLNRKHPLRKQYRWRSHLLSRGRVVLAIVLTANPALHATPNDTETFDAPAAVLFAPDLSVDRAADLLRRIALRLGQPEDNSAATTVEEQRVAEDAASFWDALGDGFPMRVEVPASLTEGHLVYCTSLMIARRDIPLGHLRSFWLPLLVDAPNCPFALVAPLSYWDESLRRLWKTRRTDDL